MNASHEYALDALQLLIPPPENRLPRSGPYYAWFNGLTLALFVAMAGMARRQGTWPIRLAVFPFAMLAMLRFIYGFVSDEEPQNRFFGTWGLQCCLKLVDYVRSPEPMLKLSELQSKDDRAKSPQHTSTWDYLLSPLHFIYDAFELMVTFRGFDWQFGQEIGLRKPDHWTPTTSRARFVFDSLYIVLRGLLLCDVSQTILQMAGVLGVERHSMFAFGGSNMLARYATSTALHFVSSILIIYGMEFIYGVCSLVGVLLCGSSPASWPPLFDNPWISTSLHDLWGRRWHQLLRRSCLIAGGYPLATVVARITSIAKGNSSSNPDKKSLGRISLHPTPVAIGTLLTSGILHHWDYYAQRSGRMPGFSTIAFFSAQGAALALEREWKKITGKPVHGFWGWLWTLFWMGIVAQPLCKWTSFSNSWSTSRQLIVVRVAWI
ncbi:hypothetical protein DL93DRAFT_1139044 [Clavulina sp. PMI_390]|nr:hypothetical protein DL93DRAFT_1139044 [Clavulina sp. PMI_390]